MIKVEHTIAENRQAKYDYYLHTRYVAGLVLEGWEVKAIKNGTVTTKDAYISFKNGECFISGLYIKPRDNLFFIKEEDYTRPRKLLLNKKEIVQLKTRVERDGMTAIPYCLFLRNRLIKVLVYEARGKNQRDKRKTIADRTWAIAKHRYLKQGAKADL